jgi:hypothetical protein
MTQESSALVPSVFGLFAGLAGAFARVSEVLRPKIKRFAEALNRLKAEPTVRGYEFFLMERGTPSFESRLVAVTIVRCGNRLKLEDDARRAVSRSFRRIAKAAGKGTRVISCRARELSMALGRPGCIDITAEAFRDANCSECHDLSRLLDQAIQRDPEACDMLTDLADVLVAHLPDPRGRPLSVATACHQLLLYYLYELGKPAAYTWNNVAGDSGDFVDKATAATREAVGDPLFDPRPAHRRLTAYRNAQVRPGSAINAKE